MRESAYGRGTHFKKVWRCVLCRNTSAILKGSFFENAKISPFTILKIAYAYLVNKVNYRGMIKDAPRSECLLDWIQFCRDVLSADLIRETRDQKLGDPGKIVVVDDTALAKRKYSRGRMMARETI